MQAFMAERPTLLLCSLLVLLACGCTSTKQSNTPRTATEQLLISNAVDQSLSKVDFRPLRGAAVFVEDKHLDCVDKGYIIGSIRHRLMHEQARLVAKPDDAEVVLEVRSGGVGTDASSSYLGIPEITLPGMLTLPEVKLINRDSQKAVAKIGLVAYDASNKRILGDGGVTTARADDSNTFVFGVGPWQNGTLRNEVHRSTQRHPGEPYHELPHQVAFGSRPNSGDPPGRVQYTSGDDEPARARP
jgi:hypothetical protein